MNYPPALDKKQLELIAHFRQHRGEQRYAIARRQRWDDLVPIIDHLTEQLLAAQRDSTAYQYLATGLHLAATGRITPAQIEASTMLNTDQKPDCLALAHIYDRQRPRIMPQEPPAPGQRITAKMKRDSYLGKYGSWHTGTIQTGPGGGFSIPGIGGIALEDIIEWLPVPDEEPLDVANREYWEKQAGNDDERQS